MRTTAKGAAIAAAVAGLFVAHGVMAQEAGKPATVKCEGINGCKGQGACGGAGHDCAGKNECKGKGWIETSAAECQSKGGTIKK
ncbi:MAG: hypothetical protein HY270_17935 [Deltaproteobacteria bacterium]|nr:hypothetical protein [Deltaproteobacteria bacterium]